MDNHNLIRISIFFQTKHDKNFVIFYLLENMLGKVLGFGRMQKQNIFCFFK